MNYFTLNNINDLFKFFVENHYQLKRYGSGEIYDIEDMISDSQEFPVMWANLIDIQYPAENVKNYNFNVLFFDILKNDKSNEQEVWSDQIQIAEDFVRFLNHNSSGNYEIIGTPILNTFTERFTDFVAGCNITISLQVDSALQSDCGIAGEDFTFEIPSFIPTGNGGGTSFDCSDLDNCSNFTNLSAQTEQNTVDILILSGNSSNFLLKSVFNTYTANTQTTLNGLRTDINTLSANTSNLNYVHLTGDTMTGGLFSPSFSGDAMYFSTGATQTSQVGKLKWNDVDGTLDLGLKGGAVTLQIGQEQVARVVNKTSPLIDLLEANYQVVKIVGATGQRLSVALAQANNAINSQATLAVVTETILKNQEGFVTTGGQVKEINTTGSIQGETWNDGDVLYLSPTTAGAITNIKPTAPNHSVIIGFVEYAHAIHGKIFVKIDNGYELGDLHNVNVTGATNGQLLQFNGTLWINSNPLSGYTTNSTFNTFSASTQNSLNSILNKNQYIDVVDEFIGYNNALVSGSAGRVDTALHSVIKPAGVDLTKVSDTNKVCVLRCRTTSNTQINSYILSSGWNLGQGAFSMEFVHSISALATVAKDYVMVMGFANSTTNAGITNGVYFLYNRSSYGATIQCVTISGGVSTVQAASNISASTWYKYKIEVNADGTSVNFYIDGVLQQTITTNIPTATTLNGFYGQQITSSSFNVAGFDLDYVWYKYNLTTPR